MAVLRESTPTTPQGGQGVTDLNYLTVMEESNPTKPQGRRRICLTFQTSCCCKLTVTPIPTMPLGGGGGGGGHCTIYSPLPLI